MVDDLKERITNFTNGINNLQDKYQIGEKGKNTYQDNRAILVYLTLRFPEKYYLYKYEMFKDFVRLVNYPYQPKKGAIENIAEYFSICNKINAEVNNDQELIKKHVTRINEEEYFDTSYKVLTQDIIYATVCHSDKFNKPTLQKLTLVNIKQDDIQVKPLNNNKSEFKAVSKNNIENEKIKKYLGDAGEKLVLHNEKIMLSKWGIKKEPIHSSLKEGDGLGYDIKSYDKNGNEIFIEVKTTTSKNKFSTFYITQNELFRSKKDSKNYLLYRVFDFNKDKNEAKFFIIKGDLTKYCINPFSFKVILKQNSEIQTFKIKKGQ